MTVTVVLPTYNRAHWLPEAIDSALRQTHADLELLVIDDGSTDDTERVATAYGPPVRYIKQANRGVGFARNRAIELARGDFVAFLDSDDLWLDFKIALQLELFDLLPTVGFMFSEFFILRESGRRVPRGAASWFREAPDWSKHYEERLSVETASLRSEVPGGVLSVYKGNMYRQLLFHPYILPTTMIVRRACLSPLVRYAEDLSVFEDWQFSALLSREHEGAFIDLETAVNRGHREPGRLTRASRMTKTAARLLILDRVWKSDAAFRDAHRDEIGRLESRLLLEQAEEALLEGRPEASREALRRRRRLSGTTPAGPLAALVDLLTRVPGGRVLFRLMRKTDTVIRLLLRLPARRGSDSI